MNSEATTTEETTKPIDRDALAARLRRWSKISTCRRKVHACALCPEPIMLGDRYHDAGPGKRAHVECVSTPAADVGETTDEQLRHAIAVCRANGLEPTRADDLSGLRADVVHLRRITRTAIPHANWAQSQLELAMAWGRELAERAEDHLAMLSRGFDIFSDDEAKLASVIAANLELLDEVNRLREHIGYWERSSTARLLGIAPDQLEAVREVLRACGALHGVTDGCDPRWIRATDAEGAQDTLRRWARHAEHWIDAGRPLLAGVPSPASEGRDG
jgi:hypothetical protein